MDELLFRRVNKMPTKETENYSAEAGSAVPAFLSKLWTLVEDPSTDELIYWDASGRSFHVYDQGRFAKEVLPLYFKHNNIASFIRQLNMYGFRKVTNVEQGSLKVDKDDMEFAHPYFLKDHEYLLDLIKRKVGGSTRDDVKVRHEDVSKVLSDVKSIRGKQENMNSKLDGMKRENEALWREVASLRQKHMKQQQIVNKLIQFLMHLVGSRKVLGKRKLPLMLNDSSQLEPSCKISRLSADESHTATPQDPCQVDNKPLIHEVTDLSNLAGIAEQTESIVQSPKPTDNSKGEMPQSSMSNADNPDEATFKETEELIQSLSEPLNTENSADNSLDMALSNSSSNVSGGSNNNPTFTRQNSLKLQNDMTDHLDTLQTDLDSLKDILSGSSYNLDPAMILGLFNPESPAPNLSQIPSNIFMDEDDSARDGTILGNELIEYNPPEGLPNLFDLVPVEDNVDAILDPLNSPLSPAGDKDKDGPSKDYLSSMEEVD